MPNAIIGLQSEVEADEGGVIIAIAVISAIVIARIIDKKYWR